MDLYPPIRRIMEDTSILPAAKRPRQEDNISAVSDRLGKYIAAASACFVNSPSWDHFIALQRGLPEFPATIQSLPHPAAPLLSRIRKSGIPVITTTTPWTTQQKDYAIVRGSHQSAKVKTIFLRDEMADMIDQKFWVVLPYDLICSQQNLRISPMGVVPQTDRRDRPIVDYSYSQVNADTLPVAPAEAMQFGQAFDRIIHKLHHANPAYGTPYMIKIDLSDGFYRLPLSTSTLLRLAVAFPNLPGEPLLVAIPLVLPMGWVASPPLFCALTETIADLANNRLTSPYGLPLHRLSHVADHPTDPILLPMPHPPDSLQAMLPLRSSNARFPPLVPHTPVPLTLPSSVLPPAVLPSSVPQPLMDDRLLTSDRMLTHEKPLTYVDVYMDDFLVLAQGHPSRRRNVRSTVFHTIDSCLRPLAPTDSPHRKEPISMKKLNKGDCMWGTRKMMLGWILDTTLQTIELPAHRAARLHHILASLLQRRRLSLKAWQQQLGELRSMVLALPGGRGMFSTLYTGLTQPHGRVRITRPLYDALLDLQTLASDLTARPTRFGEIADSDPVAYGAADASGLGMGGVWLSNDPTLPPILWRSEFPSNVQQQLVTWENPKGTINNSDLELCAQIASSDILNQIRDCRERTVALFTDNIAARSWLRKGSRTTLGPAAYLLRLYAFHQRHYRYHATSDYIAGPANTMADDASRLWHLSNTALVSHFNHFYPQHLPWTISHLRPALHSALISTLQCKRPPPELFLPDPNHAMPPGFAGLTIVPYWPSPQLSSTIPMPSRPSKFLPIDTASEFLPPAVNLSDLALWKTRSAPLARRSPAWGPLTPASTNTTTFTTSYNNNSAAMRVLTPLLHG
jgi:hypothetical protein